MTNLTKFKMVGFLIGLYFYAPILTLYFLGKGISIETVLLSQLMYSVFSFLGELPTGIFADRYGQKSSIVIGATLEAVGIVCMFLVPTSAGLLFSGALRGIASSFISGSEEALFYESTPPDKVYKKELAQYLANATLGSVISFAVAGFIIQYFGEASYTYLFAATAFILAIIAVIVGTFTENEFRETQNTTDVHIKEIIGDAWGVIKKHKIIWMLMITSLLTLNGEYSFRVMYQPLFEAKNVLPLFLGLSLSLGQLANFVLMKYVYLLEDYLPLEKALLVINVLIGLGYIALSLVVSPFLFVSIAVFLFGIFNTEQPLISDYINSRIESSSRSTVLSAFSFVTTIGLSLYRIILMVIVGAFGIPHTLLIQGIYMIAGMMIGYYLLTKCGCTMKVAHTKNEDSHL